MRSRFAPSTAGTQRLRVLTDPGYGRLLVTPLVPRFLENYHGIELSVAVAEEPPGNEDWDLMICRAISAAVMGCSKLRSASLRCCCAPPRLICRERDDHARRQISPSTRCSPSHPRMPRLRLQREGEEHELRPRPALQAIDPALVHSSTAAGLGIGVLPEFLCRQGLAAGKLQRVLPEWSLVDALDLVALSPAGRSGSAVIRQFLEFLLANMIPGPGQRSQRAETELPFMRAMVLQRFDTALVSEERPVPPPGPGQVRVKVSACGVCRTDLHVVEGEPGPAEAAARPRPRDRRRDRCGRQRRSTASPSASGSACPGSAGPAASARICRAGHENLCDAARFTGYQIDGGYAEYTLADQRFCFASLPERHRPARRAAAVRRPDRLSLLCAWRAMRGASASTASVRPRTSSPRWRAGRAARCTPSPSRRRPRRSLRPLARRRLGGRLRRGAARAARCGDHLRAAWELVPRALRAVRRADGWSAPAST